MRPDRCSRTARPRCVRSVHRVGHGSHHRGRAGPGRPFPRPGRRRGPAQLCVAAPHLGHACVCSQAQQVSSVQQLKTTVSALVSRVRGGPGPGRGHAPCTRGRRPRGARRATCPAAWGNVRSGVRFALAVTRLRPGCAVRAAARTPRLRRSTRRERTGRLGHQESTCENYCPGEPSGSAVRTAADPGARRRSRAPGSRTFTFAQAPFSATPDGEGSGLQTPRRGQRTPYD